MFLLSMQIPVIQDIAIIFFIGLLILFIAQKLHIPGILAFLLTGLLIGPHGFGLISGLEEIEIMAEIGIVLLLFTIGMEFSIGSLKEIKKEVFIGGLLQVVLTVGITALLLSFNFNWGFAVFGGFFTSLSSTAIVLKTLLNKGDLSTKEGKASLSVLIFQDLAVVPMMLILPILGGDTGELGKQVLFMILKAVGILGFILILSRFVTNPILEFIAKTRNNEFFLVFVIAICSGIAMLTGELGLSLGLGAFLAGFTLAESPYVHQAASGVIPFRDLFTIFFFVSIGMLLDLKIVLEYPLLILFGTLAVILLKTSILTVVLRLIKYRLGQSLAIALSLSQVGEFSIVLAKVAFGYQVIDSVDYQIVLAICLISMSLTPGLFLLADKAFNLDTKKKRQVSLDLVTKDQKSELNHHIVIVGFGVIGKSVAKAAKLMGIPYAVIEFNPDTVKIEKKEGTVIVYGDATQRLVLEHVNIAKADSIVVSIPDVQAVRHVVDTVSKNYPNVYIIARTRYVGETEHLLKLGAHEVVPEEYETSISIFNNVLNRLGVDSEHRNELMIALRNDTYETLRSPVSPKNQKDLQKHILDSMCINKFIVSETQSWTGKSLIESDIRKGFGISVIAIIRKDGITISNPEPTTTISVGDEVIILGEREKQLKWMNSWGMIPIA